MQALVCEVVFKFSYKIKDCRDGVKSNFYPVCVSLRDSEPDRASCFGTIVGSFCQVLVDC